MNDFLEQYIKTQYDALLECYDFVYNVNFIDLMYALFILATFDLQGICRSITLRMECVCSQNEYWQLVGLKKATCLLQHILKPFKMKINQKYTFSVIKYEQFTYFHFKYWIDCYACAIRLIAFQIFRMFLFWNKTFKCSLFK